MEQNILLLTPFRNVAYLLNKNGLKIKDFCDEMRICHSSFRNKMMGRTEWTLSEMERAKEIFRFTGTIDQLFCHRK